MKRTFIYISLFIIAVSFKQDSFKTEQLKYPRVRQAYSEKELFIKNRLEDHSIDINKLRIYLRAFKDEKKLELWAKNNTDEIFQHIETYSICSTIGKSGPKRRQGDLQIPEGFYHINIYNPYSNFHLSLGVNYPNKSDRILGKKGNLGGDIFIHGACVTIGCIPITDDKIKELYLYCIEAKNNGQNKIPVTIFPAELSDSNYDKLQKKYSTDNDRLGLWTDLKKGYEVFNETKQLPTISFLESGRHSVR